MSRLPSVHIAGLCKECKHFAMPAIGADIRAALCKMTESFEDDGSVFTMLAERARAVKCRGAWFQQASPNRPTFASCIMRREASSRAVTKSASPSISPATALRCPA